MRALLLGAIAAALVGCHARPEPGPEPAAELARGLARAFETRDDGLTRAIERSLAWIESPDGARAYAGHPAFSRDRVAASLREMARLLAESGDATTFATAVTERFDARPVTDDVLFTAYYAPEYPARRARTPRFRHPLYAPPPGAGSPWPTRAEIEDGALFAGYEIAWLEDALDAYLVHVNGSARLRLGDGTTMHVGVAVTNEHPYTSLGRLMIDAGIVPADEMSMQAIRAAHRHDPAGIESLMRHNDRYVLFRELDGAAWPRSSFGIPLTAGASFAADPAVYPPGAIALADTRLASSAPGGPGRPFVRLVLGQDTGGAIRGPGRADLFLGVGDAAGSVAGRQAETGRLSVLLLRTDKSNGPGSNGR
jgi:membrane-bound lytic murein transglycosylase A